MRRHTPPPAPLGFSFSGAVFFVIKLIIFIYLMRVLLPEVVRALG